MWSIPDIVESVAAGLRAAAEADDLEQAVYSIDALDELRLHPLIHQSLRDAGFGVYAELRYPSDRTSRRKSLGKRCDVVLTPDARALSEPDAEATLFAEPDAVVFEAAYWLEIKTVAQHTTEGPFERYGSELLATVSQDIRKLASDAGVFHAGLMLVLFTADQRTAEHDLNAWHQRCLDKGYPVALPTVRHLPLRDRLGNANASVALFPVRRL